MRLIGISIAAAFACANPPILAQMPDEVDRREAAQDAFTSGDYQTASRHLNALLLDRPNDPDLLRRRAAVEAALGKLEEAQDTIDLALKIAPDDGDIALARAYILLWRKRLPLAEVQARNLAAKDPAYPGLASFWASFRKIQDGRKLRIASLNIGTGLSQTSFPAGSKQYWLAQKLAASLIWHESSTASVEILREERANTDTQVSVGVSLPTGEHRVHLSGRLTPNADFRETWSIAGGSDLELSRSDRLRLSARYAKYRSGDVVTFEAGSRHRVGSSWHMTAKSIHILRAGEPYRVGGAMRLDYEPEQRPSLFAVLASYPDVEVDGTRQLSAFAIGGRLPLRNGLQVGVTGEFETRSNSYERTGVTLDLRLPIGGDQ